MIIIYLLVVYFLACLYVGLFICWFFYMLVCLFLGPSLHSYNCLYRTTWHKNGFAGLTCPQTSIRWTDSPSTQADYIFRRRPCCSTIQQCFPGSIVTSLLPSSSATSLAPSPTVASLVYHPPLHGYSVAGSVHPSPLPTSFGSLTIQCWLSKASPVCCCSLVI